MTRLTTFLQTHSKEVVGVLLVLFLILLALSIWAWNPPNNKITTFAALRGEVLDLQSPSVYPLDTLPTPASKLAPNNTIPRIVHRVVLNDEMYNVPLLKLPHFASWQHIDYTRFQQHEFVENTFGKEWPDILHAYHLCRLTEMQLCIFKYLVIYHYGGLYVDANALSSKSCDNMLSSDKAFVSPCTPPLHVDLYGEMTQRQGEYQSWWVMAPPKSDFLWQVVWQVVRNIFWLHTKGQHKSKFTQLSQSVADSTSGSVCYTYVACKFKHLVNVCTNDFLSLRHNKTTYTVPRFVGSPSPHLGDLPVRLVYVQDHMPTTKLLTMHKIPAIIHQTHTSRWVTPAMARAMQSLRDHAPNCEYRFYDDSERRALIQNCYPSALDAYDSLIPGAFRADLFRAIAVYSHGGIYFDSGTVPMPNINLFKDVVREDDTFVIPIDAPPSGGLYNAFFASTKRNSHMKTIITHIVHNIRTKQMFADNWLCGSLQITGPLAYRDALENVSIIPHVLVEGVQTPDLRLISFTGYPDEIIACGNTPLYKHRYPEYESERHLINGGLPTYRHLWEQNKVYRENVYV
jgi:mannosyltransferase OCH1-like enzyme